MPMCRMFVPIVPVLVLLVFAGLDGMRQSGAFWLRRLGGGLAVLLAGIAAAGYLVTLHGERNGGRGWMVNADGYDRTHRVVAEYVRENTKPGDCIALMDVGLAAYLNPHLKVIDISGLVDRHVAHSPGGFHHKHYDPAYVLDQRPRFVVLVPGYYADDRIGSHPRFAEEYRLIASYNHRANWQPPSAYWLFLFERTD